MIIILLNICISGCWDRIELEERGFVIGVAIDTVKEEEAEELEQEEKADEAKGKQQFEVTFQFVIPGALSQGGSGSSTQGGGASEASFNITSIGDTMDSITTELATRTSRTPYFQHLQMVIISEEVAKDELAFANMIDFFVRNEEMRKSIKILIAKGDARKVLEVKPPIEKLPVMFIRSITENRDKTARMLPMSRFGDLEEHLLRSESFTLQRIEGQRMDVKVAGAAVFQSKKNNLIGFLDEEETEGLNYITGEVKRGLLKIKVKDNLVVYDIEDMKRNIKAKINKNNKITFTITVHVDGMMGETFERLDMLKPMNIEGLEEKLGKEIKRIMKDTITKVQQVYKKDVLGFGLYLRGSHYDVWKQVENDWDSGENYFAQSKVEIITNVNIRKTGIVNKTERKG